MIVAIIILLVLVVVLGYTTFNLLRKNEKAEDAIISYQDYINGLGSTIEFINKRIEEIDSSLIVLPEVGRVSAYFVMPPLLSQFLVRVEIWANLDGEYKLYETSTDMVLRRIFAVRSNHRIVGYLKRTIM